MNICKYAQPTEALWLSSKPNGSKTVRCYYPNHKDVVVAGGLARLASINDTIDVTKPFQDQIIKDADYVCVRHCCCKPSRCKYYQEREE